MEINVLTDKRNELEIEVIGESHSICNSLRKLLMDDDDVKYAVYAIDHPVVGEPIIHIKGKNPKKALLMAAEQLKEQNEEFKSLIEDL